jgi:hypothetical protein
LQLLQDLTEQWLRRLNFQVEQKLAIDGHPSEVSELLQS